MKLDKLTSWSSSVSRNQDLLFFSPVFLNICSIFISVGCPNPVFTGSCFSPFGDMKIHRAAVLLNPDLCDPEHTGVFWLLCFGSFFFFFVIKHIFMEMGGLVLWKTKKWCIPLLHPPRVLWQLMTIIILLSHSHLMDSNSWASEECELAA